jgi:hypothetical protein
MDEAAGSMRCSRWHFTVIAIHSLTPAPAPSQSRTVPYHSFHFRFVSQLNILHAIDRRIDTLSP